MTGKNQLVLNEDSMKQIVQHYFDKMMFTKDQSPKIQSIKYDSQSSLFIMQVEDKE